MKFPIWTKPAIMGAIVGSIATMTYGFSYAGWYTTSSAERLAYQKSTAAVTDALVPVCVNQSKIDPDSMKKIESLATMKTSYERRDFVMKAGWATLPSAAQPDRDLAAACADFLAKSAQG